MNLLTRVISSIAIAFVLSSNAYAEEEKKPRQVLFTNVHVFNGIDEKRMENANVLVEGNLIKKISADPIKAEGAFKVDGGGRTLMPGLIDMHSHLCIQNGMPAFRDAYDAMTAGAWTGYAMKEYLD